jgi:large subunit ribosomal protein L30
MASKKKAESESGKTLKIQYVRSAIGSPEKHKLIVKSLGFKRLSQVVTRVDTPAIRGMVAQAPHLFKIVSEQSN